MAVLTPLEIVTARCAVAAADANISTYYIAMAEERTSAYGDNAWASEATRNLAVALRALHEWSLDTTRPFYEAGSVASKREGELSMGFADQGRSAKQTPLDPDLSQTTWGRELLGLARGSFQKVMVGGGTATLPTAWGLNFWDNAG